MSFSDWTKFARVIKVTKDLDFVVEFATKSIFLSEHLCDLSGSIVHLVPPLLDFPRGLIIDKIKTDTKKASISFKQDFQIEDINMLIDRWLLIDKNVLAKSLTDVDIIDFVVDSLVGKKVFDKRVGLLGHVVDVAGTDKQKHIVVEGSMSDTQILIPYVPDIVVSVDEVIDVICPEGLLQLN